MNRQHRRHGFTLIELLLVLSLVVSLLGGTVGLLSLIQKSNRRGQENLLQRQQIRRFAGDIRHDMQSAEKVEINDAELVLTSESPASEIVYRVDEGTLVRSKTSSDDTTAKSHDQYRFSDDVTIAIEWVEEDKQVQWTITSAEQPKNPIRIIASKRPSR